MNRQITDPMSDSATKTDIVLEKNSGIDVAAEKDKKRCGQTSSKLMIS